MRPRGPGSLRPPADPCNTVTVDASFFTANLAKVASGGYMPLVLAAFVYGIMLIWHLGATAVSARLQEQVVPVWAFMAEIA